MAIGNVISEIKNAFESVTNLFGGDKSAKKYPVDKPKADTVTNQPKYDNRNWQSSRGYAFQVYRVTSSGDQQDIADWKEFRLQINPQELTQDEIFAIEVTPTLRGVLVEHHGTVLKDIQISGVTGNSPMRREGGAAPASGDPVLQSGHSGFQEFHELRSYFRMYVEAKRLDGRANGELRMVFKNFKDEEYLYVEPQRFTMKRSSSRPFMYEYSIALKGIGVAGTKTRDKGYFEKLDDTLQKAQDYFDLAEQVINGSIGIVRRVERDIVNTVLNPLRAINRALQAIKGGQAALFGEFGITRRTVDSLKFEIERVEANLNDAFGRDMTAFNAAAGRTSTLQGTLGRQTTFQELQVLNALGAAKKGLLVIASAQDKVFEKDVFQTNLEVTRNTGGKYTFRTPTSVSEAEILVGDNIHIIAARELGDIDRFKDLVLLNNLKPPYITPTGGNGTLKPGNKILLPANGANIGTGVVKNKTYNITKDMREAERAFGVDIRITDNVDLAISNRSDLDLVAGIENFAQAIGLRLFLERGSLKRHSQIGTNLQIGSKVRTNMLNELRDEVVSSIGSDARVDSIPFIQLVQEGGTTVINALVKPKVADQPVPIPIRVSNG